MTDRQQAEARRQQEAADRARREAEAAERAKRDAETRAQQAELDRQRAELMEALKDAREMVSDWAGYASPYFQEKHDIDGDLKKLDDAIARMEG